MRKQRRTINKVAWKHSRNSVGITCNCSLLWVTEDTDLDYEVDASGRDKYEYFWTRVLFSG